MTLYWLTVLIVQRLLLKLIGATDNDSGSLTVSLLASRDHSVSSKKIWFRPSSPKHENALHGSLLGSLQIQLV